MSEAALTERGATWRLDILSGPNAGACVNLRDGRYRLGSCIDNDIVLADPAMAEHQAVVSLADGGASLEAAAPGIEAEGHALDTGAPMSIAGPVHLEIGATRLLISPPARPKPRRGALFAGVAASVLVIGLLGIGMSRLVVVPGAVQPAEAAVVAAQPIAAPHLPDAETALRQRLAGAGIGNSVQLAQAHGAVVASGTLPPDQRPAWMAAQMWFDGQYHGTVALVDQVVAAQPQSGPNFAIRAVSMGDPAYVIDRKGDRYTVGAVVDGGWTIDYIGSDKVVLRKDGREVAETL